MLMEAAQNFPNFQSDLFPEPIETSHIHIKKNIGETTRIQLLEADARRLTEHFDLDSIRYIVHNPSYGIRVGKNLRFYWFYYHFFDQTHKVLQADGRVVLLVLRVQFFKDALKQLKLWQIEWSQKIELGGKKVRIFVLKKMLNEELPSQPLIEPTLSGGINDQTSCIACTCLVK